MKRIKLVGVSTRLPSSRHRQGAPGTFGRREPAFGPASGRPLQALGRTRRHSIFIIPLFALCKYSQRPWPHSKKKNISIQDCKLARRRADHGFSFSASFRFAEDTRLDASPSPLGNRRSSSGSRHSKSGSGGRIANGTPNDSGLGNNLRTGHNLWVNAVALSSCPIKLAHHFTASYTVKMQLAS